MLLEEIKAANKSHYVLALLAPKAQYDQCFTLFALEAELLQIPLKVSEPMLGQMRFQWWEDQITLLYETDTAREHPLLQSIHAFKEVFSLETFMHLVRGYRSMYEEASPDPIASAARTHASLLMLLSQATASESDDLEEVLTPLGIAAGLCAHMLGGRLPIDDRLIEEASVHLKESKTRAKNTFVPPLFKKEARLVAMQLKHLQTYPNDKMPLFRMTPWRMLRLWVG